MDELAALNQAILESHPSHEETKVEIPQQQNVVDFPSPTATIDNKIETQM